jgi:ATP-binding cassette subfamily B protein
MKTLWNEILQIMRICLRVIQALGRRDKLALLFAMALMPVAGGLTNLPAVLLGKLVDHMLSTSTRDLMVALPTIGVIAAAILGREALAVARKYIVENTCTRLQKLKTVEAVGHLLRLNLVSMGPNQRAGSLQGRMHRSIEGYVKLLKLSFLDLMPAMFTAICALCVVGLRNPWLASLMASVMPIGMVITLCQMKTQRGIRVDLLRAKEDIDGRVVELISGLEFIRAANTSPLEVRKIESSCERLRSREIKHHLWMAYFDAAKYLNEGLFHILVLAVTIWLACAGRASIGDVLSYSVLFAAVVAPLREIHRILDEAHESAIRTQDFFELMDWEEDPCYRVCTAAKTSTPDLSGDAILELNEVAFTYPSANGNGSGLKNITLMIKRGEKIGLAGASGSGKSTLLRLLLGLVRPMSGSIRIAGRAIQDLDREDIANFFTFVPQTPFLFNGTVLENIGYGCGAVSREQIIAAAKCAQIHDEILALPGGLEYMVCERGANLSGGQRQRIALARAFLRQTPVVIMDEATSALDTINERKVQEALANVSVGRTLIVVAHRLSTLRSSERVLVISDGQVVEDGSYSSLIEAGGILARLEHAGADMSSCAALCGRWTRAARNRHNDDA